MDFYHQKNLFLLANGIKWFRKKLKKFKKRKKIPVVVGGTGLYFRALTEGLVDI